MADGALALLDAEKELTRLSDELARQRQALPWVPSTRRNVRDRGRERVAARSFPRAVPTPRLSLHVWAGLHSGMSVVLGDCRRVRRLRCTWPITTSCCRRCRARRSRSSKATGGAWVGIFPGRPRGGDFNADFNVWFTEDQQRNGGIEYNYRREAGWRRARSTDRNGAMREDRPAATMAPVAQIAAQAAPTLLRIRANARA